MKKFDFDTKDEHYNDYIKNLVSSPDELWDVLDGDRNPTGKTHKRSEPLGPGEYHQVVTGFVRNSKGEYLIMKRAPEKGFAGWWEVPGGSVTAGETSYTGILRRNKYQELRATVTHCTVVFGAFLVYIYAIKQSDLY